MGVLDRLKDILSGSGHAHGAGRILQPIDTGKIARELDLVRKGRDNGQHEMPKSDGATFDDVELSAIQFIESEWRSESGNVVDELRTYAARLQSFNVESKLRRLMLRAEGALVALRADHHEAVQELGHLKAQFAETNTEYKGFRERHRLTETPARNPSSRWTTIGLLVLLIALESTLNGFFFAEGAKLGLIGGIGTAVGISVVNIVLAFLVGLGPARWINHRNWLVKLFGLAFTFAGAAILVALHAFAAHLRDTSTALLPPAEVMKAAVQSLTTTPWILTDLNSYYLFAFGILCAGITIWKGYAFDDPYPGYGRQYRRREQARRDYGDEHAQVFDSLRDIKDETIRDIDSGIKCIPKYPQEAASIIASRSALLTSFKTYEGSVATAVNQLLAMYRAGNIATRSTPEPPYFGRQWLLPASALDDPEMKKVLAEPEAPPTDLQGSLDALKSKSKEVLDEYERLLVNFPHATDIEKE